MVLGFWKLDLLLFHQLPCRSFMVMVDQTFQGNTHLLEELLPFRTVLVSKSSNVTFKASASSQPTDQTLHF